MTCAYLAASIHLEQVPDAPAPQGVLIQPQHVITGLVGEQDGPPAHCRVTQQHSFLLVPEGAQQRCLGVLLQQNLFVAFHTADNHLCKMRQDCQLLSGEGARL